MNGTAISPAPCGCCLPDCGVSMFQQQDSWGIIPSLVLRAKLPIVVLAGTWTIWLLAAAALTLLGRCILLGMCSH